MSSAEVHYSENVNVSATSLSTVAYSDAASSDEPAIKRRFGADTVTKVKVPKKDQEDFADLDEVLSRKRKLEKKALELELAAKDLQRQIAQKDLEELDAHLSRSDRSRSERGGPSILDIGSTSSEELLDDIALPIASPGKSQPTVIHLPDMDDLSAQPPAEVGVNLRFADEISSSEEARSKILGMTEAERSLLI